MEPVYLYIIGESADRPPFKVGVSVNPTRRLREIQTGFPAGLSLLAHVVVPPHLEPYDQERAVHKFFADRRRSGEWFFVPYLELKAAIRRQFEGALFPGLPVKHSAGTKRRIYYSSFGRKRVAIDEFNYLMRDLRR